MFLNFDIYLEDKIYPCEILLDSSLYILFYYVLFWIFYNIYLEILRFKIRIENCAKSKWEEQKNRGSIK